MPRTARIIIPGTPHHVTQRGNNKQNIFLSDNDRRKYLQTLKQESEKYNLTILGYCLMTNHIHIIATPADKNSIAKAIGRTNYRYSQYFNNLNDISGHLWQGRFYSCALDFQHYWRALKYIERNPVRAGLVRRAWQYKWSSAGAHIGKIDETGMLELKAWRENVPVQEWKRRLSAGDEPDFVRNFHKMTVEGKPLGDVGNSP